MSIKSDDYVSSTSNCNEFGEACDWAMEFDSDKYMAKGNRSHTYDYHSKRSPISPVQSCDPVFLSDSCRYFNSVFSIGAIEINIKFEPVICAKPKLKSDVLKYSKMTVNNYGSLDYSEPLKDRFACLTLQPFKDNSSKGFSSSDDDEDVDLYCHETIEEEKYIE